MKTKRKRKTSVHTLFRRTLIALHVAVVIPGAFVFVMFKWPQVAVPVYFVVVGAAGFLWAWQSLRKAGI